MRRAIACALLASALTCAIAPLAARAGDDAGATAVLNEFYAFYLAQPNHNWAKNFGRVKPLFDPMLYTMLVAVLHSQANKHEEILDFDPFVNAQWDAQAYALGTPVEKGKDVDVPVTLMLSGRPSAKTNLTAVVRKNEVGIYQIYNFVYDPTFDLRSFLQKQLLK